MKQVTHFDPFRHPFMEPQKCSLCKNRENRSWEMVVLPCHPKVPYHFECVATWLEERSDCPHDREELCWNENPSSRPLFFFLNTEIEGLKKIFSKGAALKNLPDVIATAWRIGDYFHQFPHIKSLSVDFQVIEDLKKFLVKTKQPFCTISVDLANTIENVSITIAIETLLLTLRTLTNERKEHLNLVRFKEMRETFLSLHEIFERRKPREEPLRSSWPLYQRRPRISAPRVQNSEPSFNERHRYLRSTLVRLERYPREENINRTV